MLSSQTVPNDLRRERDVTPVLKRWSTAEGASSDAHDPKGGREASNQPIGMARKST